MIVFHYSTIYLLTYRNLGLGLQGLYSATNCVVTIMNKQTKAINNSYIYIYHVNVTQTVPDISPLMPMHQDPLLVLNDITTLLLLITVTFLNPLTHWGWETHICISKLTIIGSGNGLSPGRRQAIIWTKAGILLIRTSGTNFSEILIEIHISSFNKINLEMLSAKCRPFCLGLNVWSASPFYGTQPWSSPWLRMS